MMVADVADRSNMNNKHILIIFIKNLVLGSVKTRLAKTIGNEKAMEIYKHLIQHTCSVVGSLQCDKVVCYSAYIEADDVWKDGFQKSVQQGSELGERMLNAVDSAFKQGYRNAVIIGSDCMEITTEIISDAFVALEHADIVIGPATDGGYYLLGMSQMHLPIFKDKNWSTNQVFKQTVNDITAMGLSYRCLPMLSDIDEEKDLTTLKHFL
jgi:rSAM/selenodomain-associated transferase 1